MHSSDKEIAGRSKIEAVLKKGQVCHVGVCRDNQPYVVPFFYGYKDRTIYVHCATEGRLLEILRQNPKVCFEVTSDFGVVRRAQPWRWTGRYNSVVGFGEAQELEEPAEKMRALDIIMRHYGGRYKKPGRSAEALEALGNTRVLKIPATELSGKASAG